MLKGNRALLGVFFALGVFVVVCAAVVSPLVHFTESGHLSVGDSIQILVLIVLVVVTFWYAMSTEKIYRATLNTELNSSMPIVKLRVVRASEDEVIVEYKNVGRGPALNVRPWIERAHDPDFADLKGKTMVFP